MAARRSTTGAALEYEAELWSMLVSNIKLGHMLHRTRRDLSAEDIHRISNTFHAWQGEEGARADLRYSLAR